MNDIKLVDRINLNDIFGIISPGIFVLITLILCMVGLTNIFGTNMSMADIDRLNSVLKEWMILILVLAFFASYLFGSIIRLFANDFAEVMSGFYLKHLLRKKDRLSKERFPYPFAGKSFELSNPEIYFWYRRKYRFFGEEDTLNAWERKYFFNKCKADLYARFPSRALFYERIESYVRFLAGALVANLMLFGASLPFSIYFFVSNANIMASVYVTIASFSFISVLAILGNFRKQHTREVMNLWTSYYDAFTEEEKQQRTNGKHQEEEPAVISE